MSRKRLSPIQANRIRKIKGSFSWIDHRFINDGYIDRCSREAILLYFFLVAVGNQQGLSYWGESNVCATLRLKLNQLTAARFELIDKSLIAYRDGVYQVLSLPDGQVGYDGKVGERGSGLESIGAILKSIAEQRR